MRIVQCITRGDEFYGAQSHFLDLCSLLQRAGHDVHAVVGTGGELTERLKTEGVLITRCPSLQRSINPIQDYRSINDLREILRKSRPDLVACHSSKAGILGRIAAQREGIPNVFTAHGWSFEENIPTVPRNVYLQVERWVAKKTDRLIAVANAGLDVALKHRVCSEDRISVIHYGVADLVGSVRMQPQSTFTMTMVAGFRKQKDHNTLLYALSRMVDLPWQINFVGDGPLLHATKALCDSLQLSKRVNFHGAIRNVGEVLSRTDLMVLITNWEGLPISLIEGLSLGLPAVASDVSGVREGIIDDVNGRLVKHRDVDNVHHVLRELLTDASRLRDYSVNSRCLYEEKFLPETMLEKTVAVYEQAVQTHSQMVV